MPGSREQALARLRPWFEKASSFSGWDFATLGVRDIEPGPPWSYPDTVAHAAVGARHALDLGTGGGERLAEMRPSLPARLIATEEWHVNAPLARRRLQPLGVEVLRAASLRLPFADAAFDLVTNRHEELDPTEVDRVLAPGGTLVTQQVGHRNFEERRRFLPRETDWSHVIPGYIEWFRRLGYEIDVQEHAWRVAFPSLGEFVYLTAVSPWDVPGFDLEADLHSMLALEEACWTPDGLALTEHRWLLVATKPK